MNHNYNEFPIVFFSFNQSITIFIACKEMCFLFSQANVGHLVIFPLSKRHSAMAEPWWQLLNSRNYQAGQYQVVFNSKTKVLCQMPDLGLLDCEHRSPETFARNHFSFWQQTTAAVQGCLAGADSQLFLWQKYCHRVGDQGWRGDIFIPFHSKSSDIPSSRCPESMTG